MLLLLRENFSLSLLLPCSPKYQSSMCSTHAMLVFLSLLSPYSCLSSLSLYFSIYLSPLFLLLLMMLFVYFIVQDSCLQVRTSFTNKLQKWLSRMVLPVSYLSMLALAAPDPVKDQKNRVRDRPARSLGSYPP